MILHHGISVYIISACNSDTAIYSNTQKQVVMEITAVAIGGGIAGTVTPLFNHVASAAGVVGGAVGGVTGSFVGGAVGVACQNKAVGQLTGAVVGGVTGGVAGGITGNFIMPVGPAGAIIGGCSGGCAGARAGYKGTGLVYECFGKK